MLEVRHCVVISIQAISDADKVALQQRFSAQRVLRSDFRETESIWPSGLLREANFGAGSLWQEAF